MFKFNFNEYELRFILQFQHKKIIWYKLTVAHFTCFVTYSLSNQHACMASGINFYSQLVISAIRISDISNLITDITNLK